MMIWPFVVVMSAGMVLVAGAGYGAFVGWSGAERDAVAVHVINETLSHETSRLHAEIEAQCDVLRSAGRALAKCHEQPPPVPPEVAP
jgi:hypothetical protein